MTVRIHTETYLITRKLSLIFEGDCVRAECLWIDMEPQISAGSNRLFETESTANEVVPLLLRL